MLKSLFVAVLFASTLPVPVVSAEPNWQGAYAGFFAGGGITSGTLTDSHSAAEGRTDASLVLGGVYGGWRVVSDRLVLGVEVGAQGQSGNDVVQVGGLPGYGSTALDRWTMTSSWSADATFRAGMLITERALLFGAAGLAVGEFSLSNPVCPLLCSAFTEDGIDVLGGTRTGYVLKAGVEYALEDGVHAKVEYAYENFGSLESKGVSNLNVATSTLDRHAVKAGVSLGF